MKGERGCGFFQGFSKIKFPELEQSSLFLVSSTISGKKKMRSYSKKGGSGIDIWGSRESPVDCCFQEVQIRRHFNFHFKETFH